MRAGSGRTALPALVAVLVTLAGCTGPDGSTGSAPGPVASASPTRVPTLTPLPPPPRSPATGRLVADLRQSSRDAALGRMEVWIGNDTRRDVTPTRILYRDPRFRRPVPGERLRTDPARSERGYPLALPRLPACGARVTRADRPRLTVAYAVGARPGVPRRRVTLPVTDDNDVVARHVAARCLELEVAEVATLSFADSVPRTGDGTGTLTLVARPTGAAGRVLRVDRVTGTPLLTAAGRSSWTPRARVRGDGPVTRIRLPVQPARCDDHAFLESAGATAFLVGLRLDGRPGQLVVRMSPAGASAAIGFVRTTCGR